MVVSRKCIITGKIFPKNELIRFVLTKDGNIYLEKNQKILGRGAYCLKDEKIIEILFQKKFLNKTFKRNISNETYSKLRKEVEDYVKE